MNIDGFCKSHMRRAWRPGATDCLLSLADWSMALGTRDPAVALRGTYDSAEGFERIIADAGGSIALVGSLALPVGWRAVQTPIVGSIGIVGSRHDVRKQWGGIFDGAAWRVRMADAYPGVTATPLAIWTL